MDVTEFVDMVDDLVSELQRLNGNLEELQKHPIVIQLAQPISFNIPDLRAQ